MDYKIEKNTSNKIIVISFVYTLLIVMYHSQLKGEYYNLTAPVSKIIVNFFEIIAAVCLAFFFMKSGYLLYYNANDDNIKHKLRSRFFSLVIPFLLWNVIYMVPDIVLLGKIPTSFSYLLKKFSLYPYDGPLWFVFLIIVFTLFEPLGVKIKKHKSLCVGCFVLVYLVSMTIYFVLQNSGDEITSLAIVGWTMRFARLLPAYCLGGIVGMLKPELIDFKFKSSLNKLFFGLVLIIMTFSFILTAFMPKFKMIGSVFFVNGSILLAVYIWVVIPKDGFKNKCVICKNTFFIYASHSMINTILYDDVVEDMLFSANCPVIIASVLVPIICVLSSYVVVLSFVFLLQKLHAQRLIDLLTGSRDKTI